MREEMPPRPRLPSLTGLRAVLALIVLLAHAVVAPNFFGARGSHWLALTLPPATVTMSCFFVLSGFVVTWKYQPGDSAREFWRRRFWKIYPNHVLALAATVAILVFVTARPLPGFSGENSPRAAILQLLLLQDWTLDGRVIGSFNAPAWSLSCEVFFYAMFPLLIQIVRKVPDGSLRYAWWMLAAATVAIPLAFIAISGPVYGEILSSDDRVWSSYALPPARFFEFALGVVTARLMLTDGWPRLSRTAIIMPLVVSCVLVPILPLQCLLGGTFAAPIALVVAGLALADLEGRTGRLAGPIPTAVGEASYALYITQAPILMIGTYAIGTGRVFPWWVCLLLIVAFMASSLVVGLAVYRYFEVPIMRRWSRPQRSGTPQEARSISLRR